MAKNGLSKVNFLSYHNLMTQIEKSKQNASPSVSSHDNDPVTYRELHFIMNILNNEMNRYEQQSNDVIASTLGAFAQLLADKGVASKEEIEQTLIDYTQEEDDTDNDEHK